MEEQLREYLENLDNGDFLTVMKEENERRINKCKEYVDLDDLMLNGHSDDCERELLQIHYSLRDI